MQVVRIFAVNMNSFTVSLKPFKPGLKIFKHLNTKYPR